MESLIDEEKIQSSWPWKIFLFMTLVCSTTAFIYIGLIFGYQPFLKTRISNAQVKIDDLTNEVSLQDQKNFLKFYSQIVNLRSLLETHVVLNRFFDFLEKDTNKRVAYEVLSLNIAKGEAVLEGIADNYDRLSEQLESIGRASEVLSYILIQSQFVDGHIRFRVSVNFKLETFES